MAKIKRCPYCGRAAEKKIINGVTTIKCRNCPASMTSGDRGDAEQCWNRRYNLVSRIASFVKKRLH